MNLQTIKLNMLNDLKGIERSEITKDQVETALKANFFETLMKSRDDQEIAEWFQALEQNGEIHARPLGCIRIGFFEVYFHECYVDTGSDDYVYTYDIRQTEWNGIN